MMALNLFIWLPIVSGSLYLLYMFGGPLLAWILGRFVGISVEFRVGGWKCLRDVVVKLKKGAIESISIGEIRISFRQSLVNLGVGFITRDPKLQVFVCDLVIVTRQSNKNVTKKVRRPPTKSPTSGKGKWMAVVNIARFLSISVTDLSVKTPKATIGIKEWRVGISKDGGSKPTVCVKLHLLPIIVHMASGVTNHDRGVSASQEVSSFSSNESPLAPFRCEELFLCCEFDHDSEVGVIVKNLDIMSGEIIVDLNMELLQKNKSSLDKPHTENIGSFVDSGDAKRLHKKQQLSGSLIKFTSVFPEKVLFLLPRLDFRIMHPEHNLCVENTIVGIQLKSTKSRSSDDREGDNTRLDIQMDFSEIHLLREAGTSVLEILKVDTISSIYFPQQQSLPVRAEFDFKLGGTHCNIIMSRLKPLISLQSSKKKKMVIREETIAHENPQSTEPKFILWSCTVSAPEMTVVVYSPSDLPLYHFCWQPSHVSANNVSAGTTVHMELGELIFLMAEEYQECMKKGIGVELKSEYLVQITKISLDLGKKDKGSSEVDGSSSKSELSVDVAGMSVFLTFEHVESLVSTSMSFQALLKNLSSGKRKTQNRGGRSSKSSGSGIELLKFNLERCSVNFCGKAGLESTVVADPKRVSYGSQGGRVVIDVSADGTTRSANIVSTTDKFKVLKYSVSLDIFHFSVCINKEKQSSKMDLERARSVYQEHLDEHGPGTKVTMFDVQNAKFVRRSGGPKEITVCSLFSATSITARWEPDLHLALLELVLQLKLLVHHQKLHALGSDYVEDVPSMKDVEQKKEAIIDKQQKKKESIFAVDVEMLSISAEGGDGVDVVVQVQSIFSENARIGVLLEGLMLSLNGCRVFKSSRMQISRIPKASISSDVKLPTILTWDWVIQGLDVHICMPSRLQLRAVDDSFEDMLRGLKLITTAKSQLFPIKKVSTKSKKPSSTKLGSVRFCIRKLTADIEEEPLQGWLDEHYKLLKNEACELAVKLKFLEEVTFKANQCSETLETSDSGQERRYHYNGVEVDMSDPSASTKLQEEIYKQSFRSYYQACQNLKPSEGSGACTEGFQAGFKPSTNRTSLLSISATELDVNLTAIEGGDAGMIEVLNKLDPVSLKNNIPFSRLYGRNILLRTGSLLVQIRNYTLPLFSATSGKCEGRLILAQQATYFQPQILQDVYIGKWRKVQMLRSASGTTPPMKTYSDLPLHFQKAEVTFGVGFEPAFADISYAFTVALRRANLSTRDGLNGLLIQPPKKERSLPWWDDARNYIHGKISLQFSETRWNVLATTDPYENSDKLQIISGYMEIEQSDGRVYLSAKEFKIMLSSLEGLANNSCNLKVPSGTCNPFLDAPAFSLEVTMDWDCESGNPLDHYLHALPSEGQTREKVLDPFRSTSLSLRWNFLLRPSLPSSQNDTPVASSTILNRPPTIYVGCHDFAWIVKFWNMNYLPPHKLRAFSRWPRFGVPRVVRSGNLSMDRVMTEFMLRLDATPTCIKHMPLEEDDPAKGLTFNMTKLKYELCFGRGKQKFTFECKREPLDLVYQGIDLHFLKSYLNNVEGTNAEKDVQLPIKASESSSVERISNEKCNDTNGCTVRRKDDGFFLSSDYFTIRKQTPKADPASLLAWQEAGKRNLEMTYVRSDFENGSGSDDQTRSDRSDDEGYNVVIADSCQRVFVYGLKLLWTIENRDAVWSWAGGVVKAFEPPKPSPCRQYAQRKLLEECQRLAGADKVEDDSCNTDLTSDAVSFSSPQDVETLDSVTSIPHSPKAGSSSSATVDIGNTNDSEEDGTRHFMVNVIEPQFNLHSEEANGRFLLAAVSGRVLARSFHSFLHVGHEMIEQTLGNGNIYLPESGPELTWKRMEFSVMLEHVQAHVAPTDVDPGAGVQWLPKIKRGSPKVKRTGALLERVFMPCDMYFRYTRHKGGTSDLKVKPLKELSFNSQNITATMTSRQFQVMLDVLTNLLFARVPKPNNSSLPSEDCDENAEEEADEVVPDGVEEVELARVNLERKEREKKLLLDDIRKFSLSIDTSTDQQGEEEDELWTLTGGRSALVQGLKKELVRAEKSRKAASAALRMTLQSAAQLRLTEKEKNKSPSYAMRISLQINKVVWDMLVDGKPIAEAEINDMIFDFDRDYKDVGVSQFTSKYFVLRNCLPNAKSGMLLSAWNPPPEWGKKVMLRVDAKQGAPKDGNSTLELLEVEIYPLKIHLTETMYRTMWGYFFQEEEQDSQRRQEVWKVSTTAGSKRSKPLASSSQQAKESDVSSKSSTTTAFNFLTSQSSHRADASQLAKVQNLKGNTAGGSTPELRTSSLDRSWDATVAESVANDVLQVYPSSNPSTKSGPLGSIEQHEEASKNKVKDLKPVKSGRPPHEEKKIGKSSKPRKTMEFQRIKISQVELQVTYEGSRFVVSDLKLLMDTFHLVEFSGSWRRLFSRVKKHVIWGVLKSVTGMQGKKFKDKTHSQKDHPSTSRVPESDLNLSDNEGQTGKPDNYPVSWPKRPSDGAGDGFVNNVKGLFSSQRRKASAFVRRTMKDDADNDFHAEWGESDAENSTFARQLTITQAKKLIRRHTKKHLLKGQKGSTSKQPETSQSNAIDPTLYESDSSSGSSASEDLQD